MTQLSIYPSVLALRDDPASWDSRIAGLPVPIAGVHYDIGDGDFVPSLMLRPEDIDSIHLELPIDVHLMVRKPSLYLSDLLKHPSVSAIAIHVECDEDVHELIQRLKNEGKRVGLALLSNTPPDHLDPYLLEIDYVLMMTVKGWFSGTPFLPEVLEKIQELHRKMPELPLIVDGGIGEKTLPLCLEAGATGAVMSSTLFS